MNERIKTLAEQAGIQLPDSTAYNGHIYTRSIEKLAELLEKDIEAKHFSAGYVAGKSDGIKETAEQCLEIVEDEDDGSQDTLAVRWAMHRIRKQFGVEE